MRLVILCTGVCSVILGGCEKKASPPFSNPSIPPSTSIADLMDNPRFSTPTFQLMERSGRLFSSDTLRGKVWVADFFFATCLGICPALSGEMQKIHQETAAFPDVELVSISTDELDSPEVLSAYASRYGADARWHFLTGEKNAIFQLSTQGFKLALADASAVDAKEKFVHSGMIVLVDRAGRIRGYYDAVGPDAELNRQRLLTDLKRIRAEK
jgi:protein SCO1